MIEYMRAWVRANPVKVRAAVAVVLVAVTQLVPAVEHVAGSDAAVDVITTVIIALAGVDAARKVK